METLFTGKIVVRFNETTSTNEEASLSMKTTNVIEGTAFLTDSQTNGKGQRGRVWESVSNQNVLVSYVYYPTFLHVEQQFNLIMAVSLAVKDLLDKYLMDKATIKWPNDIYINDLKISGILIESAMKGDFMSSSIIGIGININQRKFNSEYINATSVSLETGKGCNIEMFFQELNRHLEYRYLMLKSNSTKIRADYLKAMYKRNSLMKFNISDKIVEKKVVGIDEIGQLKLQGKDGLTHAYAMHQVKMIV